MDLRMYRYTGYVVSSSSSGEKMTYELQKRSTERSPAREATASIHPAGSIRLNKEATKLLLAMETKRVMLLIDKGKRSFIIRCAAPHDFDGYRLTYSRKLNWTQFAPKAHLTRVGWTGTRSFRVPLHWDGRSFEGTIPADLPF